MEIKKISKGSPIALLPLLIFLVVYVFIGVISRDFYAVPMSVPFLIAAMSALVMNRKETLSKKIDIFCEGAGNSNIILMCLIFILAGAFAQVAKDIGAVDSTVNLGLSILPSNILITGVFIIACFISLSIGSSMGTIVALAPMAVGISEKTGIILGLALGAVVSGAMFGDNLSMISDTTIAASRTQGCNLKDKFKTNFFIVLPAAIITAIIFSIITANKGTVLDGNYSYSLIKVLPYVSVLIAALLGGNVIIVLCGGIAFSAVIGLYFGTFNIVGLFQSMGEGIGGMTELVIISLIIGGMVEVIKYNGGIDFLLNLIKSKVKSKRGAELGIALLVSVADICTANNTIAIVMAGPIAKDIADKYDVDPRKSASLLDTFSCFCQGIIPYGAQLLAAAGIAKISPFAIMQYLYYPYLMGICALIAIIVGLPKFKNVTKVVEENVG
ncbi:sodium:proton antiporter [Clostridium sporogenes]|uniref:Na+/H+ antiporter NhaC family protein n=1 Tax=Clostridium botulinum TaxID=1491 RepID=UPI000717A765|nr:Na+/H+ antiporter NhaC family protein [Clostridium botulinum]KRU28923.1 sodium:proton antiporter [Clostridium sporogenes]KRU32416.1 sodium:proton antiporter [Clostridium sporogenes]KRU34735.1 sodium:proton antiporter [Clostridium sporogenes]KRU45974.1 sodium:proton antiporter [Clostridium sporogenes]MBZ1329732.1 Na+/H+ antiporter NhaC family protein [Clostridium botulinum]